MATKITPGTDENIVVIDFTKLEARGGGRAAHVPAGDYMLQLRAAKNVPIEGKPGQRQIATQWRIAKVGDQLSDNSEALGGIGQTVYQNLQVMGDSKGLWFTRNVLEDLLEKEGLAGKAVKLDLTEHIGKFMGATLGDGKPYERINKSTNQQETVVRSEIKASFPASMFLGSTPAAGGAQPEVADEDEAEEAEQAPAPKARSNGKASAAKAAEAVTETSDDEEDEDIPIAELENI